MAVGTGIPGNFRYPDMVITGEQAHVGLPRRFRPDAALAGADRAKGAAARAIARAAAWGRRTMGCSLRVALAVEGSRAERRPAVTSGDR